MILLFIALIFAALSYLLIFIFSLTYLYPISTSFNVLTSGRLATATAETNEHPVKQNKQQQQADVMSHLDVKQQVLLRCLQG